MASDNVYQIEVVRAVDLTAADSNGYSDPFVELSAVDDQRKELASTSVKRKTLTPSWNEVFVLNLGSQQAVHLHAWDWDRLSTNDTIGEADMDLAQVTTSEASELWVELSGKNAGQGKVLLRVKKLGSDDAAAQPKPKKKASKKHKEKEESSEESSSDREEEMVHKKKHKRPSQVHSWQASDYEDHSWQNVKRIMEQGDLFTKIGEKGKSKTVILQLMDDGKVLSCGEHRRVFVEFFSEVREGQKTQAFINRDIPEKEALSFSLLFNYGPQGKLVENVDKSLNLIADSPEQYSFWVEALRKLFASQRKIDAEYAFVSREWNMHGENTLDFAGTKKLLKKLNVKLPKGELKSKLQLVDTNANRRLDFDEFILLLRLLRERPEFVELFEKYSSNKRYLTLEEFSNFLQFEQQMEVAPKKVKRLMRKFQPRDTDAYATARRSSSSLLEKTKTDKKKKKPRLEKFQFFEYMNSVKNAAFDPKKSIIYQDMNQPLTDYFIASSHNTYLRGNQLKSTSSVEMYVRALKSGCRCVELDCWDGENGKPVIYHGHTLTTKIKFKDVIMAVRNYAFVATPYPVILSLENHCSQPQQIVMADIMKDILGKANMLPDPVPKDAQFLPSPEQLRFKVLIKGSTRRNPQASEEVAEQQKMEAKPGEKPKAEKVAKELDELIYLKSTSFKGFEHSKANGRCDKMSSFSEARSLHLLSEGHAADFVDYNRRQLARIYPAGTRFFSSNYDPLPVWAVGCGIVALNYQKLSEPMMRNHGKFLENGQCGYVLKPPTLRRGGPTFDPFALTEPVPTSKVQELVVEILSARQLPKPKGSRKGGIVDPFIRISVAGVEADCREYRSSTISNNGFNPHWNEEYVFPLVMSELAILLFELEDEDRFGNEKLCHYALPVECIRSGYRVLHLLDRFNRPIPMCNLLCKFTLH
ncbi:Phosphoinositide phospholipase C [Balamuthia mandrillaris]